MNPQDQYKRQAAERAVELIGDGMVVGLGHGSTAMFAVTRLAERLRSGELKNVVGVACSEQTDAEARRLAIPMSTLDDFPQIDIIIDGADEVDRHLNMIKGGGGAMLREKMVAQASKRRVYVVDESKLSQCVGTLRPLPVEVVAFGLKSTCRYIESLGARVMLRRNAGGNPYETDQGNYVLDCNFGPIGKPGELEVSLTRRAGIVAHGLFLGL